MTADSWRTIDLRPSAGMVMRIAKSTRETNGALLEVDVLYAANAPASPMHIHPEQEEVFVVRSGTLDVFHHGRWQPLHAGERTIVPPGMVDAFRNRSGDEVCFAFMLRPALDFEELLLTLRRAADAGAFQRGNRVRGLLCMAIAQQRYPGSTYYTNPALRFAIRSGATLGRLLGYQL